MLLQQTIETLQKLRLTGMHQGLREQESNPAAKELAFEERLGLLVDREAVEQENRPLPGTTPDVRLPTHENVRGPDYFRPEIEGEDDAAPTND